MENIVYIGIALILVICLVGALIVFFRATRQQQQLHQTIIRSQNEKEIETYSHIAGEYLHQNLINGRIIPHLIRLKQINQLALALKSPRNQELLEKIQELVNELKQTETIVRHISEHIFPPHLTYFFVQTCEKHLDDLQQKFPSETTIAFQTEGQFKDLSECPTLLYNLYSIIDLFVTNSLQKAEASHIVVVLKRIEDTIKLDMSDDGIGFNLNETEKNRKGIGLPTLRGRAMLLSPQYVFESEVGKGTQFKISINITQFKS